MHDDPQTQAADLEALVFYWDCCCHSSLADRADARSLVLCRILAASASLEEDLSAPVVQQSSKTCSVLGLADIVAFVKSSFARGREEERRRRCCGKPHLVGTQAQVDCHSLRF